MKSIVFIIYYIYAIILIIGTAYLVFYKGISGWWFILTIILLDVSPSEISKTKDEDHE